MQTPWGQSDGQETIAEGITFVTTPGHGGIHLSNIRQRDLTKRFPKFIPFVGPGHWYEEDCDVAVVMLAFPDEFPPAQVLRALRQAHKLADDASWLSVSRWIYTDDAAKMRARAEQAPIVTQHN